MTGRSNEMSGAFERGIHALMESWSLLQLAIENEFAGPDTAEMAENLTEEIVIMSEKRRLDVDELENLLNEFVDCLHIVAEDGSVAQVARVIELLQSKCLSKDFQYVEKLLSDAQARKKKGAKPAGKQQDGATEPFASGAKDLVDHSSSTSPIPSSTSSSIESRLSNVNISDPPAVNDSEGDWTVQSSSRRRRGHRKK